MFNEQPMMEHSTEMKQNYQEPENKTELLNVPRGPNIADLMDGEDPLSEPNSGFHRTESDNTGYFRHLSTLNANAPGGTNQNTLKHDELIHMLAHDDAGDMSQR